MATIAQLVERQIVVLDVAGSSPVGRPSFHLMSSNKEILRTWCLAERKARIDSNPVGSAVAVAEQIRQLASFVASRGVAGYLPLPGELSPIVAMGACHRHGSLCAVPGRFAKGEEQSDKTYGFCQWTPETPLMTGCFAVLEPREKTWVDIRRITFFLVPGLAFDAAGNRLGFGVGIYDRLLAAARSKSAVPPVRFIGVCYDWQVVDTVPGDSHDIPMHAIATPTRLIQCASHEVD